MAKKKESQVVQNINEIVGVGSTPEEAIADLDKALPNGRKEEAYKSLDIGKVVELREGQYAIGAKYITEEEKAVKGRGYMPGMQQRSW